MEQIDNGKGGVVRWFSSVGELLDHTLQHSPSNGHRSRCDDWNGNRTLEQAAQVCRSGANAAEVAMVRKIMDKVDDSFRDREEVSWEPAMAGAYPIVPEALQGVPECMRVRTVIEGERGPIRVIVSTTVSANVDTEAMRKRGAAAAALAMRLAEIRPTELYVMCELGGNRDTDSQIILARVSTTPISASEAAFVFADPSMSRQVLMSAADAVVGRCFSGGWSAAGAPLPGDDTPYMRKMRQLLGLTPSDVYLPGGFFSERDEFCSDPVGWVHKMLEKQREIP